MSEQVSDKEKLDERIEYAKLSYFGATVQPIARLTGKRFGKGNDEAAGVGAYGRVQPEELIVEKDNSTYSISLTQSDRDSVRKLVVTSVVVSVLCVVLSVISSRILKSLSS